MIQVLKSQTCGKLPSLAFLFQRGSSITHHSISKADKIVLDQVFFVRIQLVIRGIIKFFPYKKFEILLNTAVLPRNLLDPNHVEANEMYA